MRTIIEKKKKEKRVVKYALRKYTVGVVSIAISASIFSPVAVAASTLEVEDGQVVVSKAEVIEESVIEPEEIELEEDVKEIIDTKDEVESLEKIEEVLVERESIETVPAIKETVKEEINTLNTVEFLSDAEAEKMIDEVIGLYDAIQYEDLYAILKPTEKAIDKFKIKAELKKKLGYEPSEEEVKVALKTFYMDKLDLEETFNTVKGSLRQELKEILTKTSYVNKNFLVNSKEKILLGLTYLEKQYSFTFGDKSAKDLILYNSGLQGESHNALFYLIGIGDLTYSDLELRYNINTYKKNIALITGQDNILDFIEGAVKVYAKENTAKEWFENSTKAWIVEAESNYGTTSIYEKMVKDERLKTHLIPLLAVSDNSIYAISTIGTVTYGVVDAYLENVEKATIDDLKADMEKTAKKQELFLDFWYRISNVNNKLLESSNIIVVDSLLDYGKADVISTLWSKETGKDALKGVREFITPLGLYTEFFMAEGQAGTDNSVNYFLSKALTDRGQETYTHELTHLLDNKVFLNGFGRRQGKGAECFARGLFESINNAGGSLISEPIFNLNLSYELGDERIQNKSPERFKTEDDLQKYMEGLMDVIYTLDYVEAQSSLNKSTEDKAILYNQLELTEHSTKKDIVNDTFSFISEETAEKLKTVDDLIDNNIVSGRLAFQGILTTGTAQDNGYYVVPLFEPIYAAMQNDKGAVGDISFKRNAYELLAQYGYSDGMAAYISDEYANDEEALKAILDTKYNGNLAEFKKDMFALRASKLSYLKQNDVFADYKELQNLMDAAVQKDLEAMRLNKKYNLNINQGVGAVRTLKTQILQSYLKSTDDFTTSIYEEKTEDPVVPPTEEKPETPGNGGDTESKPTEPPTPEKPGVGDEVKPNPPVEEEKPDKPGAGEDVKPNPPSNDEETEKPEVPDNGVVDKEEKVIFDIAKPTDVKITSSKLEGKTVDYIVVNGVKITKASILKLTVNNTLVDYNDEYYTVNDGSLILLAKLFETLSLDANKGYTISVAFTDGEEIENFATLSVVDSGEEVAPPVTDAETSDPKPSEDNSTGNADKNEQIEDSEEESQEVVNDKTEKTGDFATGKIALGIGMMTSLALAALFKKKK